MGKPGPCVLRRSSISPHSSWNRITCFLVTSVKCSRVSPRPSSTVSTSTRNAAQTSRIDAASASSCSLAPTPYNARVRYRSSMSRYASSISAWPSRTEAMIANTAFRSSRVLHATCTPSCLSLRSVRMDRTRSASARSISRAYAATQARHSSLSDAPRLLKTTRAKDMSRSTHDESYRSSARFAKRAKTFSNASQVGPPEEDASPQNRATAASLSSRHNSPCASHFSTSRATPSTTASQTASSARAASTTSGHLATSGWNVNEKGSSSPTSCVGASTHVPCVHRVNRDAHATMFPLSALRCFAWSRVEGWMTTSGALRKTRIKNKGLGGGFEGDVSFLGPKSLSARQRSTSRRFVNV